MDGYTGLIGLCSNCRHARVIPAQTGVTYYRCERSAHDERYPKYPRLPVLRCPGYTDRRRVDVPAKTSSS